MRIKASYISNIGTTRKKNEDSLLINEILVCEADMDSADEVTSSDEKQIYVVADGMGDIKEVRLPAGRSLKYSGRGTGILKMRPTSVMPYFSQKTPWTDSQEMTVSGTAWEQQSREFFLLITSFLSLTAATAEFTF